MIYKRWRSSGKTIVGIGGEKKEYTHYCPISDFQEIAKTILNLNSRNGSFTKLEILNDLHGHKLARGTTFNKNTHSYKVWLVFDILEKEGFISRAQKRRNRSIVYNLASPPVNLQTFLNGISTKKKS